jgi:predicted ABC-type transport system involved in lysophospholipase L1 biosynthesis ATPase subunit
VLARCLAPVRLLASGGPARPLPRASSVREAVAGAVPPALRHPAGAAGAAPALGLDAVLDARPADLDPPTQGLVAVARALVRNPDVLAVDAAALVPDGPPGALLARALRAVVDLEGRTVLVAAAAAALETTADEVVRLPTVWLGS